MVILTFEDVNQGYMASTAAGLLQVIQFQGRFYAVRKAYRQLQEAIDGCRQDLEEGFCSIVLRHGHQVEVWGALSKEISISPLTAIVAEDTASLPLARKPQLMFRGRVFPASRPDQSLVADLVEGQFYRGQRISVETLDRRGPVPDHLFFRGNKVRR